MELTNVRRSVLVTGAGKGLGRALVREFHSQGWNVFPLIRRQAQVEEIRSEHPDRCFPVLADISQDEVGERIRETLNAHSSTLDLVINNAGIPAQGTTLETLTAKEVEGMLQVHCLGAIRVTQACLPFLRKSPKPVVMNVTSRFGSLSLIRQNAFGSAGKMSYGYRIAKAAQNMFSICLHDELVQEGFIILSVHPGRMVTSPNMYAADADMTPELAARRIHQWLQTLSTADSGTFVEPGGAVFSW